MKLLRFIPIAVCLLFAAVLCQAVPIPRGGTTSGSGGGAATATASPLFVAGSAFLAPQNNPTVTIPSGGSTPVAAGDCAVSCFAMNGGGASNYWSNVASKAAIGFSFTLFAYTHFVTPQDITTGNLTITGPVSGNGIAVGFYRHLTCGLSDGVSAGAVGTNTHPDPGSATSTVNGDIDVVCTTGFFSGGAQTYTPSAGYANDLFVSSSSTNFGAILDHLVQSTAGATDPGASTWSNATNWGSTHFFFENKGGLP